MVTPRRTDAPSAQPGGGDGAWRPSLGYLAIAVGIAVGGLSYFLMAPPAATESAADTASSSSLPASANSAAPAWPVQAAPAASEAALPRPLAVRETPREADGMDPTPDISSYVNPGEKPSMNEVIERLNQAGVHTGLGAFSPPGTRPPLVGLAVPENFVLPPGYVRHHQATDDGQRIEAVLMFAPDYQPIDANNQPIAIPKDRVVTPELAPPGFPTRRIVIPASTDPAKSGL